MEKSEQTLIPEWLKTSGNVTIGSTATHQTTSSSLLYSDSDDHGSAMHSRNRVSASVNSHDSGRSSFSDRTTSSYFRRGSNSNGSGHSSFGSRNSSHRTWDSRDKEKSNLSAFKRHDYSDHLDNIFPIRAGKDLRRSHSLVTGRKDEPFSGKLTPNLSIDSKRNPNNSSSLYAGRGVMTTAHKTLFEKEFPSLGRDGRRLNPDLRRFSTPGLGSAIQSLPVSVSTVLGGDSWTSALAEVPVIVGSNGPSGVSPPNTASIASSTIGGLNMAKTLAQGAPRGNSTLQLPAVNQRRDELVLKQSRQLIPLKITPKSSALNPAEKSKAKISQLHQISSQVANLSTVGGAGKSSVGRLQVLKLSRELTDVPPPTKDSTIPQNSTSKVVASANVSLSSRTIPGYNVKAEGSAGPTVLEKRPNPQAESRNDFFNLMRKKSMTIPSSPSVVAVASANKNNEEEAVVEDALGKETISIVDEMSIKKVADDVVENNNGVKEEPINAAAEADESIENGKSTTSSRPCSPDAILHSEEEEVAFMRSLGWEGSTDNSEEDEGLTEEEISTFFQFMDEYLKLSPSSQTCRRVQSKLLGFAPCSESRSPRSSQV